MIKKIDKEIREKASKLSYIRDNTRKTAEELEIERAILYRWRNKSEKDEFNIISGCDSPKKKDLEFENTLFRKLIKDARKEQEILKKAIGVSSVSD
jgi:transposase-like protein